MVSNMGQIIGFLLHRVNLVVLWISEKKLLWGKKSPTFFFNFWASGVRLTSTGNNQVSISALQKQSLRAKEPQFILSGLLISMWKKSVRSKDILSKQSQNCFLLMADVLVKLQRSSSGMLLCIVADLTKCWSHGSSSRFYQKQEQGS